MLVLATAILTFTNIADICNAPRARFGEKDSFSVVGHLIRRDGHSQYYTAWDYPHALSLISPEDLPAVGEDTLVRISGTLGPWIGHPNCTVTNACPVQRGPHPKPLDLDTSQISLRQNFHAFARVRGVIVKARPDAVDPRFTYLILRDEKGILTAGIRTESWPGDHLVDAEVELEGVIQESTGWRIGLPVMLCVRSNGSIRTLKPAPTDISAIPVLSSSDIPHRQRTEGEILALCNGRFFIPGRNSQQTIMQVRLQRGETPPEVGSHVTVAGFARLDPFQLMLDEAIVRPAPPDPRKVRASPRPVREINAASLLVQTNGSDSVDTRLHGSIVSCTGVVRRQNDDDARKCFQILDHAQPVTVDVSGILPGGPVLPEDGTTVRVTGLFLTEFENIDAYASLPAFRQFTLVPRRAEDVRIVATPPRWTTTRLLAVISVLVFVLIGFAVWNRLLHTLAERRGRELFRARFASAQSELKVEERTRLAVELHDSLSQTLTGVALQIETASSFADALPDSVRRLLGTAKQMLASCRGELQSCIWDLRSRTFDEKDMTEAVTRTVDTHIGSARLSVRFNVPRSQLSETTTHAILRIVRELAVNAVRHGAATEIRIAGNLDDGVIRFSVTDNGKGFKPDAAPGPRDGHFGLQGVRERLNEFAGTLEIESQTGKGTKIKVTMKPRDDQ